MWYTRFQVQSISYQYLPRCPLQIIPNEHVASAVCIHSHCVSQYAILTFDFYLFNHVTTCGIDYRLARRT